jgi:cyanophycinase
MNKAKPAGTLVIIGGAEDKKGDCEILQKVVELSGGHKAKLVVMTTATEQPEVVGKQYQGIFEKLGVSNIDILDIPSRETANDPEPEQILANATGIFFTGGDQLRITTMLGGTRLDKALHDAYLRGLVIAGTSAGASVMSRTMIVEGDSDDSAKKNTLNLAPGMGLLNDVVIDQHFAQRGRINRLISAVAQNPYTLGVGIDEDTAIVVSPDNTFEVVGSQSVTVVDGRWITHTNVSEAEQDQVLAVTGVNLHILPKGYRFEMEQRQVIMPIEDKEVKED